jgi:hypothetical protein
MCLTKFEAHGTNYLPFVTVITISDGVNTFVIEICCNPYNCFFQSHSDKEWQSWSSNSTVQLLCHPFQK